MRAALTKAIASLCAISSMGSIAACAGARSGKQVGSNAVSSVSVAPSSSTLAGVATKSSTSRARLRMIASDRWTPRDRLDLGDGGTLFVGDGGERWLAKGDPPKLTAAAMVLDEDLVAVRRAEQGLLFVGRSGAIHQAKQALSEITSSRAPPSKMRVVSVGKRAIVGVTLGNDVLRTVDQGVTWTTPKAPKTSGAWLQLVMTHDGLGVASLAPQRLLLTRDDGESFAALDALDVGVLKLGLNAADAIYLEGVAQQIDKNGVVSLHYPGGLLVTDGVPHFEARASLPRTPLRFPLPDDYLWLGYANSFAEGRAALLGTRALEVVPDGSGTDHEKLLLATHDLGQDGDPTVTTVGGVEGCLTSLLAARGSTVVVGCAVDDSLADKKATAPRWSLRLVKSDDAGTSWKSLGAIRWNPDAGRRGVWLTSKGAVLVLGGCLHDKDPTCGRSLLVRAPGGDPPVVAQMPEKEPPEMLLVSTSKASDVVVIIGRQGDESGLRLFFSHDGGKKFSSTALPAIDGDDGGDVADVVTSDDGKTITALVWGRRGTLLRYRTGDDGKTFDARAIALSADTLSMSGERGLAFGPARSFETLDGGITWGDVTLPRPRNGSEDSAVACSADGCLIGERAFRIGWAFADEAEAKAAVVTPAPKTNAFATPLHCLTTGGEVELGVAEGVQADPGNGSAWTALKRDPVGNGASVLRLARAASKLDVQETTLLAKATGEFASHASSKPEGIVATRYAVKRDPPKKPGAIGSLTDKQLVDVEVAWYVAETGVVHHATIAKAGELDPARYTFWGLDGSLRARTSAFIVPGVGLYVRPFSSKGSEVFYFVDDAGKVTKLPSSLLPPLPITALRDGARTVFIAPTNDPSGARQVFVGALSASSPSSPWKTRWWSAWPQLDDKTEASARISTTTLAGEPTLVVAWPGDARIGATTFGVSLRDAKDQPPEPVALPTLAELGDPPRACTELNGARLELGWASGTRHPVVVEAPDAAHLVTLATGDTIARFFSSKNASCVGALVAPRASGDTTELAVILPDAMARATLFVTKVDKAKRTLVAKSMSCVAAPGDPLPKSLADAKGF